jgi:hypothetical protein
MDTMAKTGLIDETGWITSSTTKVSPVNSGGTTI